MQFEISPSVLSPILGVMSKLIGTKTVMPILYNVKIFEQNGQYLITATSGDQETVLTAPLPLENVEGFHPLLIPIAQLSQMVRAAEGSIFPLTFKTGTHNGGKPTDHQLCIDYGEGIYQLMYEDVNEYPVIDIGQTSNEITFPASVVPLFSQATAFTSNDTLRPIMMNVYFDIRPDGDSRIVATNTKALYLGRATDVVATQPTTALLQARTIGLLSNMLVKGGSIRMMCSEKFVTFYVLAPADEGQSPRVVCRIDSRLAEGRYPRYESIMPKNNNSILLDCQKFQKAVDRASVCANSATGQLRFDIVPNQAYLTIKAQDIDYSRNSLTNLEVADGCTHVASAIAFGLRAEYLTRCIRAIDTKELSFTFSAPNKACLLNSTDGRTTVLIMPMVLTD